jgi:hypothetical protein
MAFHTAHYDTYVALGDPAVPPLWTWNAWQRFVPAIDPLIQAARGKPAVRSQQYLPDQVGTVKFGRLGWNDSGHQKWSHGSPTNGEASNLWRFLDLEIWAPAWTVCQREDRAPDLFLSVFNDSLGGGFEQKPLFNAVIVFAVVSELARRKSSEVSAAVTALREITSAKLLAIRRRPWGRTFGSHGFTDSIQDLAVSGLFKPGSRHNGEIGLHLLAGRWEFVQI